MQERGKLKGYGRFVNSSCSLTSVGEVTLISGVAAASNRLMMFSVFNSLDGVTLGGGGTAGLSWDRERNVLMKLSHKPNEFKFKVLN